MGAAQEASKAADCQRTFAASSEYIPWAYNSILSLTVKVACRNAFLRRYPPATSSIEFTPYVSLGVARQLHASPTDPNTPFGAGSNDLPSGLNCMPVSPGTPTMVPL